MIHLLGWTFWLLSFEVNLIMVCPSFIQFTSWLSNTSKLIFIFKPDEGVLCKAIFIISLVKGLFQWTIYAAQEKIPSNWEVIIFFFFQLWRGRFAVWNYENLEEQQRKANAHRKNCIKGEFQIFQLKVYFCWFLCYEYELCQLK